jgi:glucokinase
MDKTIQTVSEHFDSVFRKRLPPCGQSIYLDLGILGDSVECSVVAIGGKVEEVHAKATNIKYDVDGNRRITTIWTDITTLIEDFDAIENELKEQES